MPHSQPSRSTYINNFFSKSNQLSTPLVNESFSSELPRRLSVPNILQQAKTNLKSYFSIKLNFSWKSTDWDALTISLEFGWVSALHTVIFWFFLLFFGLLTSVGQLEATSFFILGLLCLNQYETSSKFNEFNTKLQEIQSYFWET